MSTTRRCRERSKYGTSKFVHQSTLEIEKAVYYQLEGHTTPKSSQHMNTVRNSKLDRGLASMDLKCHDYSNGIEQRRDADQEADCARCPMPNAMQNPRVNGSECFLENSGQRGPPSIPFGKQALSGRMVNGGTVFTKSGNTLTNGNDDEDGFRKDLDTDHCKQQDEKEEEEEGNDECDGILSELVVHTKHFVRSFFGRTFFRGHKERPVDHNDVVNNVLVPSPFQNGYVCLGIHIRQEQIGLRVTRVFNNSLACKAHLKESDILTHLDGKELINLELNEIRGMFEGVQKTFTLTVWREVHEENKVSLEPLTVKLSITETVERSFEIEVLVSRVRFNAHPQSTRCHFITQDPDGSHQTYMHYDDDGSLSMGNIINEDQRCRARAAFYFDFYYCLSLSRGTPIINGQLCTIRHRTSDGDKIFNCNTGRMEFLPAGRRRPRDKQTYFIDRMLTDDGKFKFRVFLPHGNEDRYLMNVDGKIQLSSTDQSECIFEVFDV